MIKLPQSVTVIEISGFGGPEMLRPAQRPCPTPGPDEVLIKVAAAGVNRPDLLQRQGKYPPPAGASDIPGLEVAGEIIALGDHATGWRIGDTVCALVAGGGYASHTVAPAAQCLPIPAGLSMVEAAALPETFFTVWTNLFDRAGLQPGETVLIHGGSSGIGTTAIQLAHRFGAKVIATAGLPDKLEACRRLGADLAIDYRHEDFVEAARAFTGGTGVEVVLDMVGGSYFARNLDVLAVGGRLVQIAFMHGARIEANLLPIMTKRLIVTGSTLRPRSVAEKAQIANSLREKVWPWLERKLVRPVIHQTVPLIDADAAHRLLEEGNHIGKIVLVGD